MFDPNANPESVAARAAELAIEQMDRLNARLKNDPKSGVAFYSEPFEVQTSNNIAKMLCGYAVLKGLVPESRFANR